MDLKRVFQKLSVTTQGDPFLPGGCSMFDYPQLRERLTGIVAQLEGAVRDVTSRSLGETRF
jgi:hypothetical protein